MNEKTERLQDEGNLKKKISLVAGLSISIISALLLIFGVMIPGFHITFEFYNDDFNFNFSFITYVLLIFIGLAIASNYYRSVLFKPNLRFNLLNGNKSSILSIPGTRFIASILLLSLGVISYLSFGLGFSDKGKVGLWLYLGGPSSFFPTGFFPMIIGLVLLIYALFGVKGIIFDRNENDILLIRERRILGEIVTEISIKDIKSARITNARIGPRHMWNVIFFFQIWLLYIDGFSFLTNPHVFGNGIVVGTIYLASATVQCIVLGLLVLSKKHLLEIITEEKVYELKFEAKTRKYAKLLSLDKILGISKIQSNNKHLAKDNHNLKPHMPKFRLLFGIGLLTLAIVSRVAWVYTGYLMRLILIFASSILISEGMASDFPGIGGRNEATQIKIQDNTLYRINRGSRYDQLFIKNNRARGQNIVDKPKKLEIVDHLIAIGIPLVTGYDVSGALMLGMTAYEFTWALITTHIIIGAILILATILLTLGVKPMNEYNAGIKRYQLGMVKASQEKLSFKGKFKNWKDALLQNKRAMYFRILEITVALVLGIILGVTLNLF